MEKVVLDCSVTGDPPPSPHPSPTIQSTQSQPLVSLISPPHLYACSAAPGDRASRRQGGEDRGESQPGLFRGRRPLTTPPTPQLSPSRRPLVSLISPPHLYNCSAAPSDSSSRRQGGEDRGESHPGLFRGRRPLTTTPTPPPQLSPSRRPLVPFISPPHLYACSAAPSDSSSRRQGCEDRGESHPGLFRGGRPTTPPSSPLVPQSPL